VKRSRFMVCAIGLSVLAPTAAHADDSPYCRKVEARSAADAALLFAPAAQAQAIHFPNNGTIDTGVTVGKDFQFRAALVWSPLDFYKGFQVLEVGKNDCEQHVAMVTAAQVLELGADYGRMPALQKQAQFLASKEPVWEGVVAKSNQRVSEHVVSVLDATEVRGRAAELAKKRAIVDGDIERLESKGIREYRGMLTSLEQQIHASAMKYERQASHVRSLDPWQVQLQGGVIPSEKPVDFFALVSVQYNFGGFVRNAQETKYVNARDEELKKARYELVDQLRRFREQMKAATNQAKRELAITDKQLAQIGEVRSALAASEAPQAPHALAVVDLEIISLEADRVFLTALIGELSSLQENGT
jgi:hypothetical protein